MDIDTGKKIAGATKWSSITEIFAKLISPIVNMVLARLLTPEAFGAVATITMVISFAEIFTDAGFQKYIVQHEFSDRDELNRSTDVAFWTNFSLSVLIYVAIFGFRHSIATLVGSPGLGNAIGIASLLIIVASFSSIQMARYKREFDFKTLFFVRIGTAMIPLIVTVPLAFLLRNYWALLIGNFVTQLFNAIVLTAKSKWKPSLFYRFSILKEMFSFSAWTLLESVSVWLTGYIGVFIVGNYLNSYYLGIYKTSMSTVGAYMGIITAAITPVLFSALSRYQNDEVNFKKTYYAMQRIVATFVFPMGIGIFMFRELVTYVLLGDQWLEASGFVGLWGLTSAFAIVFSHFSSEVFRSKGNPKISLVMQLIHLAFIIPTLLIGVRHDFEFLYIARSLIRIQLIVTAMIFMQCLYGFKFWTVIKNVFPMMVSAVIMGAMGYGLKQIGNSFMWQFVVIFLCIIVYFVVLIGCFPNTRNELLNTPFVKRILGKIGRNKKTNCE